MNDLDSLDMFPGYFAEFCESESYKIDKNETKVSGKIRKSFFANIERASKKWGWKLSSNSGTQILSLTYEKL